MGTTKVKPKKKTNIVAAGKAAANKIMGKGGAGTGKRRRGPTYYANKVLVEKLKKKLYKIKYGGR